MRRFVMPLLILLLCVCGWAHAESGLTVVSRSIKPEAASEGSTSAQNTVMPVVQSDDRKLAAKINDRLFFEDMASEAFSVSRNDGRVLAISRDIEGCGAYCENYTVNHNFDARTGRLLTLDDLLTFDGMADLARRMVKERQTRYRSNLADLKKGLRAAQKGRDANRQETISDAQDRIALNEDCLQRTRDEPTDEDALVAALKYQKFVLANKAFQLTSERCSNHASRALDDVGDVTLAVPYPSLRKGLTPYGKALLLNEGSGVPEADFHGQLLRGHLNGNIPITMVLKLSDDGQHLTGAYFYDKYRRPISLAGTEDGKHIELTETSSDESTPPAPESTAVKATMTLTVQGNGLVGQWKGARNFDVRLAP